MAWNLTLTNERNLTMTILQEINKSLTSATKGLKAYKEGIQNALDLFINNYEGDLDKNAGPLERILSTVKANDKKLLTQYLVDFTNIRKNLTKKGFAITSKDGNPIGYTTDPTRNWYEKEEKESESKEWDLVETLKKLIKKAEKEGFSKSDVSKALSKM